MHVHQLAKALKTTPDTVRYYTRVGLLRPSKDANNDYKCYAEEDVKRLRFILCARQMGFSVEEIKQLLMTAERGEAPCPEVAALLEQRLADVQQRLQQTMSLRNVLQKALSRWQQDPQTAPTGRQLRELIQNFAEA